MGLVPTPSQTVGPFYHLGLDHPGWNDLTRDGAAGAAINVQGRVIDGDGAGVTDAMIEIWQANAAGRYAHPDDRQAKALDPKFRGFGRARTNDQGHFTFRTIKPGAVPGRGNAQQAPHINVTVFARGLLRHLTTRLYFPEDAAAHARDPVLHSIADPAARASLIAMNEGDHYRFDIVLQGTLETLFLDV
jgi:protocatechuate 3,4-dioxygenase, alpha subunit